MPLKNNSVSKSSPSMATGCPDVSIARRITQPKHEQFVYTPLPAGTPITRVLRLHPSIDPGSIIECEILDYRLEPQAGNYLYEALSYVWGDVSDKVLILLNDSEFLVIRNLHAALLHLPNDTFERIIRVDAICVN
jgi:hypothetical protein